MTKADVMAVAAKLRRNGVDVTPETIVANLRLTRSEWVRESESGALVKVRAILRDAGEIIVDHSSRNRKPFAKASLAEHETQLEIMERSSEYDEAQLNARRWLVTFLRERKAEFGYEPYPELFREEIDRGFAMYGVKAPWGDLR